MAVLDQDVEVFRPEPDFAHLTKVPVRRGGSALLERAGPFEIRLVASAKELKQVQRLRYGVFYEEGGAIAGADMARKRRDLCGFDAICDHLIVVDTQANAPHRGSKQLPVGTYRLLRREVAERHNGFYSQGEFDLAPMLDRHPRLRFLELGRSCVHSEYRSKRVIELLWRGLWLYAKRYRIDALIGCASLPGTNLDTLRLPLSLLLANCQADARWQVAAWPRGAADFTPLASADFDRRRVFASLPPLLKAYLRTGARCGNNAVIDHQFGTTDVFTVLPIAEAEGRYLTHYGQPSCVSGAPVT